MGCTAPNVSIVVLDFHGQRFLPALLKDLAAQSFKNFEVIIVDNGGELQIEHKSLDIRVIRPMFGANLGFAGGGNLGFREAKAERVVFLNNDVSVPPDWLESLLATLERNDDIGAVCSKVLFMDRWAEVVLESQTIVPSEVGSGEDGRKLGLRIDYCESDYVGRGLFFRSGCHSPESRGKQFWVWTDGCGRLWVPVRDGFVKIRISSAPSLAGSTGVVSCGPYCHRFPVPKESGVVRFAPPLDAVFDVLNSAGLEFHRDWRVCERGIYERDEARFSFPMDLEAASACSLLVRKSALDGELPFDREFFAYFEDTDLSLRLRKAGYKIVYEPRSVVRHHRSGTSGIQSPLSVFYGARNWFWVIAKHAPMRVVWRAVSKEMWELGKYRRYLNDEFSLSRLYWSTWYGFVRRFLIRILDLE